MSASELIGGVMRYRRAARFVPDPRQHYRPLDRNARARIMHVAERLERASKGKGQRCGVLGLSGLAVLRALIYHCLGADGRCDPSYARLQQITGLAKGTIAKALHALERLGLLVIIRRLIRRRIARISPVTGNLETILTTTQATSLYQLQIPSGRLIPLPAKPSSVSGRNESQRGFHGEQVVGATLGVRLGLLGEIAARITSKYSEGRAPDWRTSARLMIRGARAR